MDLRDKTRILVTGGAGFVGSAMAEKLAQDSNNFITIVDNLLTGDKDKIPALPNIRFIKCDVNDYSEISSVFHSGRFHYVFHYAALVGVQRTLKNPVKVLEDIKGIENILKLSKNTGVEHVYFSSSSEVYGEPVEFPQNEETTPLNSRLPYAIVKNVGEAYLRSYQKEYDLNFTIFRFFNTYGPKQSKDFVMSRFISMALTNRPISIYGEGSQTRTFCFVQDNVDACYRAFKEKLFVNDVVNIGGNVEIPILELARVVKKLTGSESEIKHLPALKEGDMTRRLPDTTKMRELLQREPLPLEEGIKIVLSDTRYIL
ncbi:MAG: NAD-dependent epimerase/dehydratase family protein [Flavobacteriales bacterium]|nr:NAD-dependent epimerase/dehydratase family protein [Flavobacteriales bacterium]